MIILETNTGYTKNRKKKLGHRDTDAAECCGQIRINLITQNTALVLHLNQAPH